MSYYHLPSHLKRCFAYCAIFPKDYVFQKKQLVLLWMAEGLIEQRDNLHLGDVGEEYFQDLFFRSLFQSSINGGFIMHDLVNDLAQLVAGGTCFRLEDLSMVGQQFKKEKVCHTSYILSYRDRIERFEPLLGIKCLRTFLPLSLEDSYVYAQDGRHGYYIISKLPDSIRDLKHLRLCYYLKKLPSEMQNLINLHHLDMEGIQLDEGMPLGIEELKSVHTLYNFIVGKGEEAILMNKERIDNVVMQWIYGESRDRVVLEMMKPHGNFKELTKMGYGEQE
ncbi:hypothetical protein GH714_018237 [Hevea brasiliensis]|uniref:Disease resistance protein winged helix domain-containing protein n=1 Tax=Hevea brasiliensis TaxID=3981 RepID=A0A6A6N4D6_HEVBR|nr:hypothetical protein GH714_018237 [Hevea brasiliensis]